MTASASSTKGNVSITLTIVMIVQSVPPAEVAGAEAEQHADGVATGSPRPPPITSETRPP